MGWQWHQLDYMQIICTSVQTDNHASTSPVSFYRPRMPFLPPKQQRQSTEGILTYLRYSYLLAMAGGGRTCQDGRAIVPDGVQYKAVLAVDGGGTQQSPGGLTDHDGVSVRLDAERRRHLQRHPLTVRHTQRTPVTAYTSRRPRIHDVSLQEGGHY